MRTREASTERLPALQPEATQPASSSKPTPAPPAISQERLIRMGKREAPAWEGPEEDSGRSCPEVSRMLMTRVGSQ